MAEDYEGMTVAELKVLLREQGLPVSGKKSELIERLSNAQEVESPKTDEVEVSEAEETVEETVDEDDFVDDSDRLPQTFLMCSMFPLAFLSGKRKHI